MTAVLGINAVFHDPAAALLVDGVIVAAAEEERFSRRKHGKSPVPFSTWELPEQAIAFCLARGGLAPTDLDAVAYSYDPALLPDPVADLEADEWERLRTVYAQRFGRFLLREHGIPADPQDLLLDQAGVTPPIDPGTVLIHPGAAAPARRWPPERFAAVAAALLAAG